MTGRAHEDTAATEEPCDLGWSLSMLARGYAQLVDPVFSELPRGARGWQLLHTVVHKDIRSQIALADYLGVDRTVMPYVVDDLQAAGYVERQEDPRDRRVRKVTPTPWGVEQYHRLSREVDRAEDAFFAGLPEADRTNFMRLLSDRAKTVREA